MSENDKAGPGDDPSGGFDSSKRRKQDARAERLADALRANLARRKAATRATKQGGAANMSDTVVNAGESHGESEGEG